MANDFYNKFQLQIKIAFQERNKKSDCLWNVENSQGLVSFILFDFGALFNVMLKLQP